MEHSCPNDNGTDVPVPMYVSQDLVPRMGYDLTPSPSQDKVVTELTKFTLRKALTKYRLAKFKDEPSTYLVWKTTFQEFMQELSVSPAEEFLFASTTYWP